MYSRVRWKCLLGWSMVADSWLVWRLEWMSSMRPLRYFVVTYFFLVFFSIACITWKCSQLHFAGQSSRRSGSRSRQIIRLTLPCPCMHPRPGVLFEGTQVLACRHDKASSISSGLGVINGIGLTPFSSSSPFATIGTAHQRWLAKYTARHWSGFFKSLLL
jgi:hypothetical protein